MAGIKWTFVIILFFCASKTYLVAQDQEAFADRYFLILASTKNSNDAVQFAKEAAKKTGLIFYDNGLKRTTDGHASYPADSCKRWGDEYPCYYARGRSDDGVYLSVEFSSGYGDFAPDYFIVIAANGSKEDTDFNAGVKKVKKFYPKSYVKKCKVYIGCMH